MDGTTTTINGIEVPDDPTLALVTLGESIIRNRSDLISVLIKKHSCQLAETPFPPSPPVKYCEKGDSALHLACRIGQVDSIRTLLRLGVNISCVNDKKEQPFDLLPLSKHAKVCEQAFYSELLQNVCSGNVSRVNDLLSGNRLMANKADLGGPDQTTLLHWAASLGQGRDMVRVLVKYKCDVNAQTTKSKSTPAHEASLNSNLPCLQALLEFGADFSIPDSEGKTPKDLAHTPALVQFFATPSLPLEKQPAPLPPPPPMMIPASSSSSLSIEQRRLEEQDKLIDSLRNTIDQLLREHGVRDHVLRLQDHVGALTRQLAATAEQRDKLQNLYVASDRELERVARELAMKKSGSFVSSLSAGEEGGEAVESVEELKLKIQQLREEVEREQQEGFATVRMHLTYEADLRAEIKALHERLLMVEVHQDKTHAQEESPSLFSSFWG